MASTFMPFSVWVEGDPVTPEGGPASGRLVLVVYDDGTFLTAGADKRLERVPIERCRLFEPYFDRAWHWPFSRPSQ